MLPDFFATTSPTAASVPVPLWLDLTAVVVGSLSGLLYAREHHLDLVGFVGMAIICGLGGGLVRDIIMQVGDVYMLNSRWPILVCVIAGVVGFLFPTSISAHPNLFEWVDILSVGLFSAAGADKAFLYHLDYAAIILMGTITGVGGGMMRDIFLGEVPHIFRRSNWYALCAIAGAMTYHLLAVVVMLDTAWAVTFCVLVTILLRRVSLRYNLYSPADVNLAPAVKRGAQSVAEAAKEVTDNEVEHARELHERQQTRRRTTLRH